VKFWDASKRRPATLELVTLDECRHEMYRAVEERILRWITGVAKVSHTGKRKRRRK